MGAEAFKIEAGPTQALFGFGDAVCVPAIRWIAEHYLNPLCEELSRVNSSPATSANRLK